MWWASGQIQGVIQDRWREVEMPRLMLPTQMAIPLNMVFPETVGRCN
jgi:hypothetical protein